METAVETAAAAPRAVTGMEEPPVVCVGSTANHSRCCNTRGMSTACRHRGRHSYNNSGNSQCTAVYCHTTRAAAETAVETA